MKICENCGASFDENLPKCPYCGTLNEEGAEKEYKEKLERIRTKLDNVDELASAEFKAEAKIFLKVFLVTFVIVGILGLAIYGGRTVVDTTGSFSNRVSVEKKINSIAEFSKAVKEWNALYDAGKYEEMTKTVNDNKSKFSGEIYNWEHSQFINSYSEVLRARDAFDRFDSDENRSAFRYTEIVFDTIYVHYLVNVASYRDRCTEKDSEILQEEYENLTKRLLEATNITEAEYNALCIKACGDGYPQRSDIQSFCEERWGE